MKKFFCTTLLTLLIASAAIAGRQDYPEEYLGLPGDNLNLYAVMNLFQESETLEAFERSLNEENTRINNLDLNNDGYVDYLTVSDYVSGNVHTIVIRSILDRNEYQDVAVFTVEQLRNGEVQIQLIGDEALYGRNYIVEPNYAETPNPGYTGRAAVRRNNVTVVTTTYYEVAAWPVIRFIFSPRYVVWRSSWYWGYYPVYYRPWKPFFWHHYYGYHYHWYPHYYTYYRHWHQPRWVHYRDYYYVNVRVYSSNVSQRITAGTYRQTYSRPETRRDGEALYATTVETRSRSVSSQAETGRRQSAATTATQSQTRTRSAATAAGSDRRSTAATGSGTVSSETRTRRSVTTQPATRTQTSNSGRSSTPATRSQNNSGRTSTPATTGSSTVSSETRRSATTQPTTRTQTSSSGRSSTPAARTQTSSSGRSNAPAARTQTSSSGRSNAPAARTQTSSSGRSNAPAARTQSSSSSRRSSGTVSSRSSSSKSSGTTSKSSSSSGNSDTSSRSSRR